MPSVNPYTQHLMILPEDRPNAEMANGFHFHHEIAYQAIRVLPHARGWLRVVESFETDWLDSMRTFPNRIFLLIIDLDGHLDRVEKVKERIPPDLLDRVFVLGTLTEPEELTNELGSFEIIGKKLADDCATRTISVWNHRLLTHNQIEADRLREAIGDFAFRPR